MKNKLTPEQEYEIYQKIDREITKEWAIIGSWVIVAISPVYIVFLIFWIDWNNLPDEWYLMFIPISALLWLLILSIKTLNGK
jgi:hypothetical protein